jgi:Pectate lyase superfamily protein
MYTVLRFMLLCYVHMQGELWSARGRLSYDWGYAGYRHSTAPPPSHPATSDLDVLHSGSVLFMPAGRYLLTAVINIRKNVTLRGAGRGSTVLYFPHSLSEIYGSAWLEGGVSAYSHGTGFINVGGWDPTGRNFTLVARVTQVGWRIC